jgi:hypothetical protein
MTSREMMDPAIQSIFDAMRSYMVANSLPSCSTTASESGSGTTETISCMEANGDSYTYTYFSKGVTVAIQPATVSLGPGGTQQFTATATNPDGSAVAAAAFTWSLLSGPGSIDASGLYTAPASVSAAANASIKVHSRPRCRGRSRHCSTS